MLRPYLLASLALVSGYQVAVLPRACPPALRTSSPVAGLFDALKGKGGSDRREADSEAQLRAMEEMRELRRDPVEYEVMKNRRRNYGTASQAAKSGNIPAGWGSAVDEASGARYFFDEETKQTSWEPPAEMLEQMVAILEDIQRKEMQEVVDSVAGSQ
uniref:WW domain-containing protein n=1 Tax=Calcidiscus leptoporus TaxID=127549 RepID=A0A7S0IYH1_9EUKA